MTGQVHCPRTNRHRPTCLWSWTFCPQNRVALSQLQTSMHELEQRKYPTGFHVCSPLRLMYSSSPYDTSSQQCNADFLKCVERPFLCAFTWPLKLSTHPGCQSWGSESLCYHHFSGSCLLWTTSNSFWKPPWGDPHMCNPHMCNTGYQSCCSPETLLCAVKLLLLGNGVGKATGLEISSASSHQGSAWRHSLFQSEEVKRTASAVETSLFLTNKVHHILTQPQAC